MADLPLGPGYDGTQGRSEVVEGDPAEAQRTMNLFPHKQFTLKPGRRDWPRFVWGAT